MPRAAARILQHCLSPPPGPDLDLKRVDSAPGMRGEAGASSPGSRSDPRGCLPGSHSARNSGSQDCTRTWARLPSIALGPGLGSPGLHSDSPPGYAGSRECFAQRQRRSPRLGGQQGVPTKLSLDSRLRGAAESLCNDLAEPVLSK